MATYQINVNGERREVNVHPSTPLLWVLREDLKMTGTKYGCGISACGACTVHVGGVATRSCIVPISHVGDRPIVTIEEAHGQTPLDEPFRTRGLKKTSCSVATARADKSWRRWRYSNTRLNRRRKILKSRWVEISVAVAPIRAFARYQERRGAGITLRRDNKAMNRRFPARVVCSGRRIDGLAVP